MSMAKSIEATSIADILERVLDKGIVIAGDISISLADVELLTIKIRLVVCSVDKAQEIGINWWQSDPALSSLAQKEENELRQLKEENEQLKKLQKENEQLRKLREENKKLKQLQSETPSGD